MKTIFRLLAFVATASLLASCSKEKKAEPTPAPEPIKEEVYQPTHQSVVIDLKTAKKYDYHNAPSASPATSVTVNYDGKRRYNQPIEIKYGYANGDTYTYIIPAEFGIWKNESGKYRLIVDMECTVWVQGKEDNGKFHEFVFYGKPKYNGYKIKPNSYTDKIRYRSK